MSATSIRYERLGSGEPLLLIHGTGLTRRTWDPVLDFLAPRRELLLIDLPGHGASPIDDAHDPTPIGYAHALTHLLDDLGLKTVHVAGNSVGGWTALELAKAKRARSVVALAPAGLWPKHDPISAVVQLWLNYYLARLARPLVGVGMRSATIRAIALHGACAKARQMPPSAAQEMIRAVADTRRYTRHLAATRKVRFRDGRQIGVPVTIAWGEKEAIVPPRARRREELPAHTTWVELSGCGHVMTWDDPRSVAQVILDGTAPVHVADVGSPSADAVRSGQDAAARYTSVPVGLSACGGAN